MLVELYSTVFGNKPQNWSKSKHNSSLVRWMMFLNLLFFALHYGLLPLKSKDENEMADQI